MSGRGKRRGRPPKTPAPAEKKFQFLKKPKYLQNDSQLSTPSASRASSPQDSEESSRKSFSRNSASNRKRGRPPTKNKRGGPSTSYASRRSYNSPTYNKTDYHYGSDFGDSSEKSEDELAMSRSESPESYNNDSDSDFSLSSYSNVGPSGGGLTRSVTPEPVWLKEGIEIPQLELPKSSDDLLVPKQYVLRALGIYEVLRRYRNLVRLSPFRVEDYCAALVCDEQSALLTEIHIALIKAILREEDSQQTHFGPLDQKDSVNISLYLIDTITWPEVLRIYVESDPAFNRQVLEILSTREYPYSGLDDRLTILQFLTDQFLTTTFVRDDLIQEGPIHYDDHCRNCHRLGNLLCCETCPAVYHLECVDPPLIDVPSEDWQCHICKSHSVSGVNDCISSKEKQGSLCRQEHLGFDRHARKYWFVCRRLFIETEDGSETWYFSSEAQLENLLSKLDGDEFEKQLCKEINEYKDEIIKQMQLTEQLTNENKGSKKSYLEIENERIAKESNTATPSQPPPPQSEESTGEVEMKEEGVENGTMEENSNNSNDKPSTNGLENATETSSSSSSLPPPAVTTDIDKNDQTHLTRSRTNQISNGTFYFKLGMENLHKEYMNQFSTNPLALNKPQKNEERDKKRHLSHKFSLTDASNFKWGGLLNGTEHSLIAVFKQTLLTFESSINPPFMHCNWPKLRKVWLNAVAASTTPQDFLKVLMVLQTCMKNVLYASVWHEQLGHIHLYRITSAEREERKKIEKREKREENEEERNRLAYNYVKYSLGLRHQVWKQKGEEYRIHGQWGWLWSTRTRRRQCWNEIRRKRIQSINVIVKKDDQKKVICLKRQAYENIQTAIDYAKTLEKDENDDENKKSEFCELVTNMSIENVFENSSSFDSMDISEALKAKTRIIYPKIAKKSSLDDLLERREKLRDMELKISAKENNNAADTPPEIPENIIPTITADSSSSLTKKKLSGSTICVNKMIQDITDNKSRISQKSKNSDVIEKCVKIHRLQSELTKIIKMLKIHPCFSDHCRNSSDKPSILVASEKNKCFSTLCLKECQLKSEINSLIAQLRDKYTGTTGKKGILHQKLAEAKNNDLLDILNKYHLGDYMSDEYFQYSIETCIEDIATSFKDSVDFNEQLISAYCPKNEEQVKKEVEKEENGEPEIKEEEVNVDNKDDGSEKDKKKKEDEEMAESTVRQPNRRFLAVAKPKKEIELEKELDAEGKEKVYSTISTAGKIYLKKPEKFQAIVNNDPQQQLNSNIISKYPAVSTFTTLKNTKSILILPKFEVNRIARRAGKYYTIQFNHQAKNNNSVWPYPCPRPFFRTCWIYRTFCANTFAALGLQLRILWTCLRWDDMQTKPATLDGKNQVTTETEIVTTELLKHRNIGPFMDLTQYFRRRVVIPLELPKTVREVTSIRSGLRKRKRAESPQQTDPQVNEEWIDEDKLELWEIRQYGEKQDRANVLPITRTSTGKLPLPRQLDVLDTSNSGRSTGSRASSSEIKEKMEQQLRLQRDANNKKRAEEMKGAQAQFKMLTRKYLVRNPDGTTKVISETVTQPVAASPKPEQSPQPQKIQVLRTPDGKMSVRGLQPNQKLVQTSDGKYLILPTNSNVVGGKVTQTIRPATTPSTPTTATVVSSASPIQQPPQKVIIRSMPTKTIISANNLVKIAPETAKETQQVVTSTTTSVASPTPTVQKILTSTGQIITQQVQGNVISSANLQQLLQQRPGQKILIQQSPSGVQKLIVASPQGNAIQQQTSGAGGEKRYIIQNSAGQQQLILNQNNVVQQAQPQQALIVGGQKIILQNAQPQQLKAINTNQGQQIQLQVQESTQTQPQQQQQTQQIVVQANGSSIAQQLAQGKIQVVNMNGQQVLVKNVGANQVIVGQVKSAAATNSTQIPTTPVKQIIQPTLVSTSPQLQPHSQIVKTIQSPTSTTTSITQGEGTSSEHAAMLANHPPGTIIKCVTASVMQTNNGPRIVLQGLQGNEFNPQQTLLVQQQVKQQLMKVQEASGKPGGLVGPTKIYLAITPQAQSQPPPLTPVQNQNDESVAANEKIQEAAKEGNVEGADERSDQFVVTQEYIQDTIKNVLRQGNLNPEIEEKLLNLQRYQEKQAKGEPFEPSTFNTTYSTRGNRGATRTYESDEDSEESEDDNFSDEPSAPPPKSRRRGNLEDDDDEWVLDTPRKYIKKSEREKTSAVKSTFSDTKKTSTEAQKIIVKTTDPGINQIRKNIIFCNRAEPVPNQTNIATSEISPEKSLLATKIKLKVAQKSGMTEEQIQHHKLQGQLLKHKENLKKIILKKRESLEKDLQNEVQKELSAEMAIHIKNICAKQESIVETKKEPSKYMKKKMERLALEAQQKQISNPLESDSTSVQHHDVESKSKTEKSRPKKSTKSANTSLNSSTEKEERKANKKKGQKLYCICQTPYDKSKFYIGCDLCNNWFHGECVGITEEQSKEMTDFVCNDCEKAKESQELFCLCRTPYDNSQFYICCDKCQDWFHGKCVGILQSEADFIDEYICPKCQKNTSINFANMKDLNDRDFELLSGFLKDISIHKSAWPFIDPVDATEVPDYYNVVKEPMDLKQIETKINNHEYACLSDFIKDMTKIFDNCRYYNQRDSTFCKCAEDLEAYFIQKLNTFRDELVKT